MARTATAAAALALLAAFASPAAASDLTFPACSSDNDCVSGDSGDAGTTMCNVISTVNDPKTGDKLANFGFCVQCMSDCDCDVNEWCAPAVTVSSQWWDASQAKAMGENQLQAQVDALAAYSNGNMQLLGQCVEFGDFNTDEGKKQGSTCSSAATGNGVNQRPKDANDVAACGYAWAWQPEYFKCVGKQCPKNSTDPSLKNSNYGSPGACAAWVNGSAVLQNNCDGGVAWEGTCNNHKCQYCQDGGSRCQQKNGMQQTCIDGEWVEYLNDDGTHRTLNHNVVAQLNTAIVVFLTIVMLMAGFGCFKYLKDDTSDPIVYTRAP